jgi:hypothetical protein
MTIWPDYHPQVLPPETMLPDIQRLWGGDCSIHPLGVWDPPKALSAESSLDGVVVPGATSADATGGTTTTTPAEGVSAGTTVASPAQQATGLVSATALPEGTADNDNGIDDPSTGSGDSSNAGSSNAADPSSADPGVADPTTQPASPADDGGDAESAVAATGGASGDTTIPTAQGIADALVSAINGESSSVDDTENADPGSADPGSATPTNQPVLSVEGGGSGESAVAATGTSSGSSSIPTAQGIANAVVSLLNGESDGINDPEIAESGQGTDPSDPAQASAGSDGTGLASTNVAGADASAAGAASQFSSGASQSTGAGTESGQGAVSADGGQTAPTETGADGNAGQPSGAVGIAGAGSATSQAGASQTSGATATGGEVSAVTGAASENPSVMAATGSASSLDATQTSRAAMSGAGDTSSSIASSPSSVVPSMSSSTRRVMSYQGLAIAILFGLWVAR